MQEEGGTSNGRSHFKKDEEKKRFATALTQLLFDFAVVPDPTSLGGGGLFGER